MNDLNLAIACLAASLSLQFADPQPPANSSEWNEVRWSEWIATNRVSELQAVESRLPDGSRIDILTADHAIEVEWARKWPEAIGQSVFYALATDRQPAIWLLKKRADDEHYLRCLMVCRHLGIRLQVQHVQE